MIGHGNAPTAQRGLGAPDSVASLADAVSDAGRGIGATERGLLLQIDRQGAPVGFEQLALVVDILLRNVGGSIAGRSGWLSAHVGIDGAEVDTDRVAVKRAADVADTVDGAGVALG